MIKLQQSVGKDGINRINDVRKIQTALVQTEFLTPSDYNKECLNQTIEQYITTLKSNISNSELERSVDLKDILEGTFIVKEEQLTATITAIEQFQKKYISYFPPDGRVDPNGRTIQQLSSLSKRTMVSLETSKAFDIIQEDDKITVNLRFETSKTTKILSANKIRNYIALAYNWNGMIKMLQFIYQDNGDNYLIPNQLTGTESDNLIIIPDQAVIYIIQTQLKDSIATQGLSQLNLSKILREVDGLPGNHFITKIIKAKSKAIFFDESKNESQCRIEDDMNIDIPGLKADSETLYQFFRDMVRARNGLWSDVSGVMNIVGFRRKIDAKEKTAYNDTIATCWLEADENGILKPNVEVTIASTEPGNRIKSRQLVPQTMTLVPGYHHLRQPGGRTRNAVKIGKNESVLVWERDVIDGRTVQTEKDTTMNFHQGNNNFTYPGSSDSQKVWLSIHGFNSGIQHGFPTDGFGQQTLHELNLIMSEIYLILSRYGLEGKTSCYKNLTKAIEAIKDKKRIDTLFEQLHDFPLRNVNGLIEKFKKHFYINTNRNRERVLNRTKELPEFEADIIEKATVGGYSLGCQIIYDTEVFYTFWTKLLQRAQKVGQLRWYYTLIDATELKRSDLIA